MLGRLGQAPPLGRRPPWVLLTVTAALDGTDLAKGELSHPQVVIVFFVRRPPQNAVLETPANSELENPSVTPEAVSDRVWTLCSPPLERCLVRPLYRAID